VAQQQVLEHEVVAWASPRKNGREEQPDESEHILSIAEPPAREVVPCHNREYRERWGTVNRRAGRQRVWKMRRAEVGAPPLPANGAQERGATPAEIVTVRLPVPDKHEDQWNRWSHTEHMPSVMGQVPHIRFGHRCRPFDGAPGAP
jgi:hypothetical protein